MSIRNNFFYSLVLTASNYIFPLLVYPYISRVLGVEKIGICDFVDSIVNYFILFSTIGISIIGIREIASSRQESSKLNEVYTSLIAHTIIPTVIACIIFFILVLKVDKLYFYKELFFIGIGKVMGTAFMLDWFYKGLENFKFITIRTIIIKVLYVICIFLFIKDSGDYILYFGLTTLMVLINSIYNLLYSRKFVRLKFDKTNFRSLITPNLINGLYLFLNTMYMTLNVAVLGFVSTSAQVGYYTTSSKVFGIILAIYTAFTGVLLPRMSLLISEGRIEDFKKLIGKSIDVLITFSVPLVFVTTLLAPQIIRIIAGPGYEGAYLPAIISMPLIFVVGYEQILVVQILTPLKEDKIKLFNSIIGACVGLLGNIVIVKYLLAVGATIVWATSEIAVLVSAQYFVTKLIGIKFPIKKLLTSIVSYIPLCLIIIILQRVLNDVFLLCFVASFVSTIYFVVLQCLCFRNKDVINLTKPILLLLKK